MTKKRQRKESEKIASLPEQQSSATWRHFIECSSINSTITAPVSDGREIQVIESIVDISPSLFSAMQFSAGLSMWLERPASSKWTWALVFISNLPRSDGTPCLSPAVATLSRPGFPFSLRFTVLQVQYCYLNGLPLWIARLVSKKKFGESKLGPLKQSSRNSAQSWSNPPNWIVGLLKWQLIINPTRERHDAVTKQEFS